MTRLWWSTRGTGATIIFVMFVLWAWDQMTRCGTITDVTQSTWPTGGPWKSSAIGAENVTESLSFRHLLAIMPNAGKDSCERRCSIDIFSCLVVVSFWQMLLMCLVVLLMFSLF